MKKIGILNFQYSTHNYGAVLQAAALEYICRQLGYDVKHLDYMAKQQTSLKGQVGWLLRKLGLRKSPLTKKVANMKAFENFRQNFINRTKRIHSAKDFKNIAKDFDFIIVGSDQVWRPAYAKDTIAFFLGYVPNNVARIAYAASFGAATWEYEKDVILTEKVRNELNQFKAISCREESGVKICKDTFSVESTHVLDPLLLVDEHFLEMVISKSKSESSARLVFYKLDISPEFKEDLKILATEMNCDAVNIYLKRSSSPEYQEVPDWLALISNSEVVVTDSFHCICLALRFEKKVIYCPNESRGQARLDSLFKKLDIEMEPLGIGLKSTMFKLSKRSDIDSILNIERKHSQKFLVDALND